MAISQLPQAPYRQDRKIFPTPIIGDVLFSEIRDCNRGNPFPEYGTPYPNANKWPDHKLVYIKPVDIERNEIFEFFYAAERENQDLYNFALGNKIIANREFRMVTRTYVTLRENFKPEDIEFGTPMPNVPEGKFDDVSYVFFDKEQQNMQQEELNSLFVLEAHTYLEAAVLDEVLTLSTEKQDPLPPKFRVLSPTTTTDELAEGSVETPVLTGDQLAVTEEQINTDLKRKRTVSRSSANNTTSLSGKQVTNDLQVANVVETIVPDGTTITTSALTVDGSVESLGNGQSVQRVITAPELFTAKSFATQRPDPVPEKFRVLSPTESTEESIAGTAEMPTLVVGDLESTEQQVNVHVKRKRKTSRDATTLPKSLTEKATTNDKQVATITQTLQTGDTSVVSSATVDIQSEALGDGTYVVRKVEVPELFTAESFSVQRPDTVPEKFRALIPTESIEENEAGTAEMPELTTGDLEATEQQVNVHVKRKRKTRRDSTVLPTNLTEKATTNEKQIATVTQTLQVGDTNEAPTATKDIQSEALGDGTYVVRKVEVPELFTAEAFSVQRPDPVPEKFRVAIPTVTTEQTITGNAVTPTLTNGDLQIEEQQQNKFVKRVRKTSRGSVSLPKSLTQKATTNDKQLATIKQTLQTGDTSVVPSATVDVQSEALGDGTYLVSETSIPKIFEGKIFSIQKTDTVPEKFRSEIPIETETINKVGTIIKPSLVAGELERSVQQANEFVFREQITKRSLTGDVTLPEVQRAYVEGTIVNVSEKLSTSPTIESGLLVSQSVATPIGDGKFVVETVKVPEWPALKSSEWDNELQVQVQRTEQFIAPTSAFTEVNTSYRAVNKDRSLKVTETEPTAALTNYVMSFPIQVDVRLPDVLKSISVQWAEDLAQGAYDSDFSGSSTGESRSLSGGDQASSESSASIKPELIIDIERPWGADLSATAYYFFLKGNNNVISESAFLSKLGTVAGGSVQRWPTFKPVSHTIVLTGGSAEVQARVNWNAGHSVSPDNVTTEKLVGDGTSYRVGTSLNAVTIPPTIHAGITISGAELRTKVVTATAFANNNPFGGFPSIATNASATHTLKADVNPKTLAATTPVKIPTTGKYVVKSEVVPYKWGWARCSAVVLDASKLA